MIEIDNLSKRYGEKLAADGLDFAIQPGIVTSFLGPERHGQVHHHAGHLLGGFAHPSGGRSWLRPPFNGWKKSAMWPIPGMPPGP
jgi:ABC-2 type transport system ATP-binding protein